MQASSGGRRRVRAGVVAAVAALAMLAAGCSTESQRQSQGDGGAAAPTSKTIVVVPKQTGDPFFAAVEKGAKEAAAELGYEINYAGPPTADAAGQVTTIENAIQTKPAAITVAANDPDALAPALRNAKRAGIAVSSYNADVAEDARDVFVSQASDQGIAEAIVDTMAEQVQSKGHFLLVTSVATAPNQNRWIELMKPYMAEKYADMTIDEILPGNDDPETVFNVTRSYLTANKDLTGVFVIGGGMSGAVKAMNQVGIDPLKMPIGGLCIPSDVRADVKAGTIKNCVLWSPLDLGYATIYAIDAQLAKKLPATGSSTLASGRLGNLEVADDVVTLGKPVVFTAENIDQYQF
jgi:ABC-type sugar transport system substrate-binding protein